MRHTWVYLIERKSEVFDCFSNLEGFVEIEMGRKIKCLQSDGEKEYFSGQFNGFLQKMGIRREFSCNAGAKRRGREEKSVGCGSGTGNAGGEELAQVLLGRGGKDHSIHPEPDRRQSVGARAIFRNKAELATLEGVR